MARIVDQIKYESDSGTLLWKHRSILLSAGLQIFLTMENSLLRGKV